MAIARPSSPKHSKITADKANSNLRGKPKRPLSAYNLFFQLERERLLNGSDGLNLPVTSEDVLRISIEHKGKGKRPHRKSHGKISFLDLARTIADRWKTVDPSVKKVCDGQASLEKEEYDEKMREWHAKEKENGKTFKSEETDSDTECEASTESSLKLPAEVNIPVHTTGVVDPLASPSRQTLVINVPNPVSIENHEHSSYYVKSPFLPRLPAPGLSVPEDISYPVTTTPALSVSAPMLPLELVHDKDDFTAPEGIETDADFMELRILRHFGLDSLHDDAEPSLFYSLTQ